MGWYHGYINMKNNKCIVLWGVSILLIILFHGSYYYFHERQSAEWTRQDIVVIKNGYYYTFVKPDDNYNSVTVDIRSFVRPSEIVDFAIDSKIDKNKLIVTYINRSLDLIICIIGESDNRIIKVANFDNQSVNSIYPKLWITNNAYFIFIDGNLYKVDKESLDTEKLVSDIEGIPAISATEEIVYKNSKNYISIFASNTIRNLFSVPMYSSLQGWGEDSTSLIIGMVDKTENISLLGHHKYNTIKPSYGSLKVEGDLGRIKIVKFIPNSGEEPFIDWELWYASLKDRIEYRYYHYYIYDSQKNCFYEMPNQLVRLFSNEGGLITAYIGKADLEKILQLTLNRKLF